MDIKNRIIVELYEQSIPGYDRQRLGRVVTTKSLNEEDLINIAIARNPDLSYDILKESLRVINDIALEQIANGASVSLGMAHFELFVNGVFFGNDIHWDDSKYSLTIHLTPDVNLSEAVSKSIVDVVGFADSGMVINQVIDVLTGEINRKLSPGGPVNIFGRKIKIAGDKPDNGISLINQQTGQIVHIPVTGLAVNEAQKITFVVPSRINTGTYKLCISTQYSNGQQILDEPRSLIFEKKFEIESVPNF